MSRPGELVEPPPLHAIDGALYASPELDHG
jgi:hypothetical protein